MRRPVPVPLASEESALVAAARAGDRTAFDALLKPHLETLFARVRSAMRSRPDLDADEAVQETLVRAYQAFDIFDPRYRFGQYLFGIAKYVVRRHVCATSREIAVSWQDATDGPEHAPVNAAVLAAAQRALASAERVPPPDAHALQRTKLCEVLAALLTYGGYPHQQLAFAFATALWGKRKSRRAVRRRLAQETTRRPEKVPLTSDPDRVVRELSTASLAVLGARFQSELELEEGLSAADLAPVFAPLSYRLSLTVGQLFAQDIVSLRRVAPLLDRNVGETRLADYFGHDARKSVADWVAAVKTRTSKYLTGRFDVERSPLPMPPDLDNRPAILVEHRSGSQRRRRAAHEFTGTGTDAPGNKRPGRSADDEGVQQHG